MKKISLEHSIRNIVTESVGNVNDLKTSRAPKAVFNQSVQIEPPTGEEHPGRSAMNVANRRKAAKQNDSLTRTTFAEDYLTEKGGARGGHGEGRGGERSGSEGRGGEGEIGRAHV